MDEAQRRSDREVAGALGSLIAGVEDAKAGITTVEEPEIEQVEADLPEPEELDEGEELESEGEDEPTDDPDAAFMVLTHEGQEHPKTESEVRTLAQQGLHFTQKMNALSAEKREWEQGRQQAEAELGREREEYAQVLPVLRQQIEQGLGAEPDWVALAQQVTAQEYNQARAHWDQQRARIDATKAEEQRVQGLLAQQREQQVTAWREAEAAATLEKIPEWREPKVMESAKSEIQTYLLGLGIPHEMIGQIHDSNFWVVLRDAVQGRQAQNVGTKEVPRTETKAAKPGSGKQTSSGSRRRQRQRERARQSGGKVQDIAPLMAEIFESRERGR